MREIKFRAWHEEEKRMMDWDELACEEDDIYREMWLLRALRMSGDLKFMQYTGLKDQNGKEIYEGDILKRPCSNAWVHGDYSYQDVVYRNGTWIIQYLKSEKGKVLPKGYTAGHLIDCYDYDYKALVFDDDRLTHENSEVEVVGNIYENPELIGE